MARRLLLVGVVWLQGVTVATGLHGRQTLLDTGSEQQQSQCPPRRIYIDMGVNWCNTLRLYDDLVLPEDDLPSDKQWHVFGFEANPLLSAYAEQFVGYLNGDRPDEPKNCLPHSGSSLHLHEYATAYGCKGDGGVNWRSCVFAKLEKPLAALQGSLNPALNSSALLKERLDRAVGTCSGSSGGGEGARTVVSPTARNHSGCNARFTFIPAAVAATDGWLSFDSSPRQLIRGGSVAHNLGQGKLMDRANGLMRMPSKVRAQRSVAPVEFTVRTVDVVTWMATSFRTSDFVVLKMDVEGAEYPIFEKLAQIGKVGLVDVLSIEVHPYGFTQSLPSASKLMELIKREAPRMRVMEEENGNMVAHKKGTHAGYDRFSMPPKTEDILEEARSCGIPAGKG